MISVEYAISLIVAVVITLWISGLMCYLTNIITHNMAEMLKVVVSEIMSKEGCERCGYENEEVN